MSLIIQSPLAKIGKQYLNNIDRYRPKSCISVVKTAMRELIILIEEHFPDANSLTEEIVNAYYKSIESSVSLNRIKRKLTEIKMFAVKRLKLDPECFSMWKKIERPSWEHRLKSNLAEPIIQFVKRKRAANIAYEKTVNILLRFDAMVAEEFFDAETVSESIVIRWMQKLSETGNSKNTVLRDLSPIKSFCKYMHENIDSACYVFPDGIGGHPEHYEGHRFTLQEIIAFFKALDSLEYSIRTPYRHLTAPVVFRLLYSCGLRVGEIRRLRCDEVDLKNGWIRIRDSKAHGMRNLLMHPDMLEVMQGYDEVMTKDFPDREYFFVSAKGTALCKQQISKWFRLIWDKLDIVDPDKPPEATARDFRHFFAFSVMKRWYENRENIDALAPYLVCWMGHANFAQTCYYINFYSDFLPNFKELSLKATENLVPTAGDDPFSQLYMEVPYDS